VPLDGRTRRKLRALGHHLDPVVIIGHQGVTEGIVAAVDQALHDHELVKVKVNEGPAERHEAADALASQTGSEVAQVLGRVILLFRQRPEASQFDLAQPDARAKPGAAAKAKAKAGRAAAAPPARSSKRTARRATGSDGTRRRPTRR
jgi:RNA-binding protein